VKTSILALVCTTILHLNILQVSALTLDTDFLSSSASLEPLSWIGQAENHQTKIVQFELTTRRRSEWPIPVDDKEHVSYLRMADPTHYIAVTVHEREKLINVYDLHRKASQIEKIRSTSLRYPSLVLDSNITPDGKALAIILKGTKGEDVAIYHVVSDSVAKEVKLINDVVRPGESISLDWDRQSQNLAYASHGDIFSLNLQSGNITFIGKGIHARWLPNGNILAYDTPRGFVIYDIARKIDKVLGVSIDRLLRDFVALAGGDVLMIQTKSRDLVTLRSDVMLVDLTTKKILTVTENEFIVRLLH